MSADPERKTRDGLAGRLGLLSLALAAGPLSWPGAVLRSIGLDDTQDRRAGAALVGARELAAAAGLLMNRGPVWLWARVGGDVMDLAALRRASRDAVRPNRAAAAIAVVAGITALDLYAAVSRSGRRTLTERAATTVRRPPQEVYRMWRRLETLPSFMAHLDRVDVTGPGTSHWRSVPVAGRVVEWDAEITEDTPGERLAWQTTGRGRFRHEGQVRFDPAPGGRGTEIHVVLRHTLPAGRLLGADPRQQLDDDLRRFKQVAETGEVIRSDGAPSGKLARNEFPQRPAQPLAEAEREEVLAS